MAVQFTKQSAFVGQLSVLDAHSLSSVHENVNGMILFGGLRIVGNCMRLHCTDPDGQENVAKFGSDGQYTIAPLHDRCAVHSTLHSDDVGQCMTVSLHEFVALQMIEHDALVGHVITGPKHCEG